MLSIWLQVIKIYIKIMDHQIHTLLD